MLQRSATTPTSAPIAPVVYDVLRSPGRPLDSAPRAFMESRFARDFGHVRVHDDDRASASAQSLGARAYTVGSNVVFGARQYAPSTPHGKQLLAHELAHTVQQDGACAASGLRTVTDRSLESEADRAVTSVMTNGDVGALTAAAPSIARWGGAMPDPVRGAQVDCVRRLGGCANTRPGGLPSPTEIASYNTTCRNETSYAGPDVTPTGDECLHGAAMPPRPRSITVLDWGENWNAFNFAGGMLNVGEINVEGVRDMVDQIKGSLAQPPQPECIGNLTIIGHGSPGAISVGDGTGWMSGRHIDGGSLDPTSRSYDPVMRATLAELTPLFCNTASVTLRGCNVGDGAAGATFVQLLANLWGVRVSAHVGVVRAGGYWTTGQWTSASPAPTAAAPPPPPAGRP